MNFIDFVQFDPSKGTSMTQDWVASFDEAYHNAVIYGTGFIKVTANGPEGLNLSVVDPKDYFYLGEKVPEKYTYGTPLLDAMKGDKHDAD